MSPTSSPTATPAPAAELEKLRDELAAARGDAEANRVFAEQHAGLLDRIHKLEEELFDERLAFARAKETLDSIDALVASTADAEVARISGRKDISPDVLREIVRECRGVVANVRQNILYREQ